MTVSNTIPDIVSKNYSGIVMNQNIVDNPVSTTAGLPTTVVQNFKLPSDYKRKSYIPDLTGFQIRVESSQTPVSANLQTQISDSGSPATIDLDDTSEFPNSGTVVINNEIFTYSGKTSMALTGISSAQLGTSRELHVLNAKVKLVLATYKLECIVDATQKINILGTPTGGSFTLTYNGGTTSSISYDATAANVQSALESLTQIGSGNVSVSKETTSSGNSFYIKFIGQLSGTSISTLTATSSLTGGSTPSVEVVVIQASDVTVVSGNQTEISVGDSGIGWFDLRFKSLPIDEKFLSSLYRLTIIFTADAVTKIYATTATSSTFTAGSVKLGSGSPTSRYIAFRILAAVADSGKDLLTNDYRSVVVRKEISSIATEVKNQNYWMSKPNPSEFGVENLYFDLGQEKVIDSVYLDPTTPNVYFNVYYSTDSTGPGYNDETWDNLMWTPVRKTFKAAKRDTYVFPEPISAKYVKIEFSHLQPQYYPVGTFQKPILYKKHPKWILDYFLTIYTFNRNKTYDVNIGTSNTLTYDALDLAFNYYQGDIFTSPSGPTVTGLENLSNLSLERVLTNVDDYSGVAWDTLMKIKVMFRPYQQLTANHSFSDNLISKIAINRASGDALSYPIEAVRGASINTDEVSVLERESLLLEKNFPVMSFYITCRHGYKEALAKFEDDRAYFVGVNEIAFQRNIHSVAFDAYMYNESTNDFVNAEISDFSRTSEGWNVS